MHALLCTLTTTSACLLAPTMHSTTHTPFNIACARARCSPVPLVVRENAMQQQHNQLPHIKNPQTFWQYIIHLGRRARTLTQHARSRCGMINALLHNSGELVAQFAYSHVLAVARPQIGKKLLLLARKRGHRKVVRAPRAWRPPMPTHCSRSRTQLEKVDCGKCVSNRRQPAAHGRHARAAGRTH